ncbi:MAG: molecular chaperone DnaJ [Desulfobacteraceae bacterium 4572_88]|nr:MAG: molecular chaperone DnaJ [Desulfobacteraceae bacterium 4572_88]RLC20920.1 MAG: DUF1992 domain-containing protein [Deltaproteobacteria bacterium]
MLAGFEKIVEERIQQAQRKGAFKNLPGAGKPLVIEDDRHVPEDLRLAYKILKNADCIPPEIELKKEIRRTEDILAGMDETVEKYHTMKKLNFMIMKLNALRDTFIVFEMPQQYLGKLAGRFESEASENKNK